MSLVACKYVGTLQQDVTKIKSLSCYSLHKLLPTKRKKLTIKSDESCIQNFICDCHSLRCKIIQIVRVKSTHYKFYLRSFLLKTKRNRKLFFQTTKIKKSRVWIVYWIVLIACVHRKLSRKVNTHINLKPINKRRDGKITHFS